MDYWYMLGMLLGEWQTAQADGTVEAAEGRYYAWACAVIWSDGNA